MENKSIIDGIKKQLTGDKNTDIEYLKTELAIYKNMSNEEVVYAIANMLFKYFDPEIKEKLDLKTHAILDERREQYEKVLLLLEQNKNLEAKKILLNLVNVFQKATYTKEQNYYDFDQMIEYYIFCENLNNARKLKVRRYPEPVTYYMYQLSEIYLKENNIEQATFSLNQALTFNPRCQYVLQSLAKIYFDNNKEDLGLKTIKESLKYSYTKEQLSYAYLLIAKYFEKHEKYDIAAACYLTSDKYQESKFCKDKIIEITKKYSNIKLVNIEKIFKEYDLQQGVSELVIQAIKEFIEYTEKIKDYESVYYLLNIMYELTDDKNVENILKKYEKILEERQRCKTN